MIDVKDATIFQSNNCVADSDITWANRVISLKDGNTAYMGDTESFKRIYVKTHKYLYILRGGE